LQKFITPVLYAIETLYRVSDVCGVG